MRSPGTIPIKIVSEILQTLCLPATECYLSKSDYSSDEYHRRYNVALCWITVCHTESWSQNKWDRDNSAYHCQVMLWVKNNF